MGITFLVNTDLATISCSCGGTYAIQERFRKQKYQEGGSWTCPYCQTWWGYAGNGENERLKRENANLLNRVAGAEQSEKYYRRESEHFRGSRDALKGVVTKIKKRIAHGVCPCCKRTFQNVRDHIKTEHPKFIEPAS